MNAPAGPAVDTVVDDMAAFGVKDFQLPEWMREEPLDEAFGVLPQNWDAVQAFIACATQWRRGPKGDIDGLRYEALEVVLRRLRIADPDDAWIRVRIMEGAALREFAKQRA